MSQAQPVNMLQVGAPLPSSIGRCADMYAEVRALRLAMAKETEAVEAREKEIREHIIDNLSKSGLAGGDTGASGLKYRAQVTVKRVYRAADWASLHAWIAKNDRFDMLQKRLSDTAVKDWVEQNQKLLPGLEAVNVPDVSITKV